MYIIKNRNLAGAISFLLKEDYKELKDKYNDGRVYGFYESDRLYKALDTLKVLREELN